MSEMGGKAGKLGAFFVRPWGIALTSAALILAPFVEKLFESGDAAKDAEAKTYDFAGGLDILTLSAKQATDAMTQLVAETRAAIKVQGDFLKQKALVAGSSLSTLQGENAKDAAEIARLQKLVGTGGLSGLIGMNPIANDIARRKAAMASRDTQIELAREASANAELAASQSAVLEGLDRSTKATGDYSRAVGELELRRRKSINDPVGAATSAAGYLSEAEYRTQFKRLTEIKNAEVKAAQDAEKAANGAAGKKKAAERAAASAAKAEERRQKSLADFSDKSAESIQRINERFGEQPKLIAQADQATRQLSAIIDDLGERKPAGFKDLIAEAQAAKQVIADSLQRPYDDLIEASQRRQTIDKLIAADREDEAVALQTIWDLEKRLGAVSADRRQEILDTVVAERELNEELDKRAEITNAYLDATRSVRSEIEAILSGTGKLSNLKNVFKQLQGKVLAEQLFGDVFRDLEKYVKSETAIDSAVDIMATETKRAGKAAGDFADTLNTARGAIVGGGSGATAASGGGLGMAAADWKSFQADFDAAFGKGASNEPTADGEIVVTALKGGITGISPERYFEEMTKRLANPIIDKLSALGVKLPGGVGDALAGGVSGFLTAGPAGGILGAIKGIKGLPTEITNAAGDLLKGVQTGTQIAAIKNALGLKTSTTGSQIAGGIDAALGANGAYSTAVAISDTIGQGVSSLLGLKYSKTGGSIFGALGGIIGGLFKSNTTARALVTNTGFSVDGADKKGYEGANSLGAAVSDSLSNIVKQLGGEMGNYLVSIGTRGDEYRVNTTTGSLKIDAGAKGFGQDSAAAIAYAIADAIADGAIKGISPAVAKALNSDPDIEKAVSEAIKVSDLEKSLKYMGNEVQEAFDDFAKTAADRVELAKKYGVDLVKVEALNAKERQELLDKALDAQVGSLKDLIDELTFGSGFEGSAVDQRALLLDKIATARTDADNGVEGAGDVLANLLQQLNNVSKTVYGTTGGFANDRNTILETANSVVDKATTRISEAEASSLQAVSQTNDALDVNNQQNAEMLALLAQNNALLTAALNTGGRATSLAEIMAQARTS